MTEKAPKRVELGAITSVVMHAIETAMEAGRAAERERIANVADVLGYGQFAHDLRKQRTNEKTDTATDGIGD